MSTHTFSAVAMDVKSAHTFETVDGGRGLVSFDLRTPAGDLAGCISIHGTGQERLAVLKAWAHAEGVTVGKPVTDDYGHEVMVPA